jgi:uncharacterized protein YbbC (DUF1343 family)/CubicO group peptidase (beta-lactamase class C family)
MFYNINRHPLPYFITMKKIIAVLAASLILCSASPPPVFSDDPALHKEQLSSIASIVDKAVNEGKTPGAVVVVGNSRGIYYHRAFGYRSLKPEKVPMTEDTVFDLASLTKVVATTTAVMQLVEKGKLSLDAPVSRYWPAFRKNGKARITIRHLLTHYSGLRADLKMRPKWTGYRTALRKIIADKPVNPPGSSYLYSDINFEILGEVVRRVSHLRLDSYCARHIFGPLGMKDTGFRPDRSRIRRTAPTEYREGKLICGEAHDPSCYAMGGISGHAGLFSTGSDLSVFAEMMLNGGKSGKVRIIKSSTVEHMTIPQSPPGGKKLRGLGWDIEPPFASNAKELFPVGAYGHLGYTGTSLWIDPVTDTFIIILTNRLHPDGGGDLKDMRAAIRTAVSDMLGPASNRQILEKRPSLQKFFSTQKTAQVYPSGEKKSGPGVMTGIDVLYGEHFASLKGKSVGLITNHTGRDSNGQRTIDLIYDAPGVRLKAVFSPEHGLNGDADSAVSSTRDTATGLPVYSLYGSARKPTAKMLKGLDALVFDIQDAGVRFYTYISTMGYAMEAAAKRGIPFYVLDRPDPITASLVQGPVSDESLKSFTAYFPLPIRHGMTVGELAGMFNAEYRIGAKLHVIRMTGYKRSQWYDETGLTWINPSPNLRSLDEAVLYPGVAMVEGANVSVGRGTATPFEIMGAPWISADALASHLNARKIPGVRFEQVEFTPESGSYERRLCRGVRVIVTDRGILDSPAMGIEIISALYRLYPEDFKLDSTLGMVGAKWIINDIRAGLDPHSIAIKWQSSLEEFSAKRSRYLLY